MIARLSRSGSSSSERAIVGNAVAMIVESRVSMKSEQATINGMIFFAEMAMLAR